MGLYNRSSFAHGVPTQISRNQYDVALPDSTTLGIEGKESQTLIKVAECFILLCPLIEILEEALSLVYDLRSRSDKDLPRKIRRLETSLDEWIDLLSDWKIRGDSGTSYP